MNYVKMLKMKKKKFYVNLYILIPAIYTGIAVLGVIAAYELASDQEQMNESYQLSMIILALIIGCISFMATFIVLRLFLKPLDDFVDKTKKMPIFSVAAAKQSPLVTQDISQINAVFDNVANILSNVEARELFPNIIGSSDAMRSVFTQIIKVAPTDSTVLITGESGTGKELVASSIHEHSLRKDKPFIPINCVAIPEGLLESELFGHEKGAFTGAISQKKGKFEIADGGTVFLDEIGDMPMATQAKLLRALQEKVFERVGGNTPVRVDIRFIAATNKSLLQLIKEGKFREDLYFRLNVFSIVLPPLRERREDISMLVGYFLNNLRKTAKLSTRALQMLIGHNWSGNVRELKNAIERATIMSEAGMIDVQHLPESIREGKSEDILSPTLNGYLPLDEKISLMEKEMIVSALKESGGIQVKAAGILGINQRSLWHRIKKHEIDVVGIKKLH